MGWKKERNGKNEKNKDKRKQKVANIDVQVLKKELFTQYRIYRNICEK